MLNAHLFANRFVLTGNIESLKWDPDFEIKYLSKNFYIWLVTGIKVCKKACESLKDLCLSFPQFYNSKELLLP